MKNLFVALFATLLLVSGCSFRTTPRAAPTQNIATVQRFLDEVLVQGRVDLIDELCADDMVWRNDGLLITDKAAYKDHVLRLVNNRWYGRRIRTVELTPMGDAVVAHYVNATRNMGSLLGGTPTRRESEWHGTTTFRLENGKIAEAWTSGAGESTVSPRFYAAAGEF